MLRNALRYCCINFRYYSASIIKMSGISDNCTAIWYAAITAFFNFIFTFIGIAVVERIGRRPLFIVSLIGKRSKSI